MSNESPTDTSSSSQVPSSKVNKKESSSPLSPSLFWMNIQQEASSLNYSNISSPKKLLSLINTLLTTVDQSLVTWLYSLIQKYPFVIPILEQPSISFTRILISIYFKEIENDSLVTLIQNMFQFIIQHTDVPITTYKYMYYQFGLHYQFYTHKQQNMEQTPIINKEIYLKHFALLEILHQTNRKITTKKPNSIANNNNKNTNKKSNINNYHTNNNNINNEALIKNYFYFTSPHQILIKQYEFDSLGYSQSNFPNLSYGFVIAMKIYIDSYSENNNNNNNTLQDSLLSLIEYDSDDSTFSKNHKVLEISLTYNPCQIYIKEYKKVILGPVDVPTTKWIELKLKIEPNSSDGSAELIFELSQQSKQSRLVTNQSTTIDSYTNITSVSPITLFRNFTGKISSYLIYSIPPNNNEKLERALLALVTNDYNIKSNEIISNLLYETDPSQKTKGKFKSKQKQSSLLTDLSSYIVVYYLPEYISYSSNKAVLHLEDFTCHFQGIVINEDDFPNANGVMLYKDKTERIDEIGGVSALLPLSEIIIRYKDILLKEDSTIFEKYIMFILKIWLKGPLNVYAINRDNVFSALRLFIESLKLKHQINETTILEILFDILGIEDVTMSINSKPLIKMLLDKHFLCKFEINYQLNIISALASLIKNRKLDESFTKLLPDLFELIRVYDVNKSSLYCCKEHKQLFKQNNPNATKVPFFPIKESLINVIILMKSILINSFDLNDIKSLIDFLCIDFSPCAQNELISVIAFLFETKITEYIYYDNKIASKNYNKEEVINQLMEDDTLIDVLLFRFSKGLVDTKTKIVHLFKKSIFVKIKEKWNKGNSEIKNKCCELLKKIFNYMEMSIISGGVFINKKYLIKNDVYRQTVFGVDAKKRKGCSYDNNNNNNNSRSRNRKAELFGECHFRRRKYSDDELMCFSRNKYVKLIEGSNSSSNSNNNSNSTGNNSNLGSKVILIKEFKECEKISLNSNNNESNDEHNSTPECLISNINVNASSTEDTVNHKQSVQQEQQRTTIESQEASSSTPPALMSAQADININKGRDSNTRSSLPNKNMQKMLLYKRNIIKTKYRYEKIPKGTLPLFYFTNNSEYNNIYLQLYTEYESWITQCNFNINNNNNNINKLEYKLFKYLLSITTKTVVHSNSIELIDKWCSCLQKYVNSNIRELIHKKIYLFLFETLLYCTLIEKYNYTSLLNTYSHLSFGKFKTTLSNVITNTKSLLKQMLLKSIHFVPPKKDTLKKPKNFTAIIKDMLQLCLELKKEFPQQLHTALNEVLTGVLNSLFNDIKDNQSFISLSKGLYFCISSFNIRTIPNILINPFDFHNKLVYTNNNKTWYHYELALKFVNNIFNHIKAITVSKVNQKLINQLSALNKNDNNNNNNANANNNNDSDGDNKNIITASLLSDIKDIEIFAKSIANLSRNKLLDDNIQLTSLFKLFACLLFILILYITENSVPLHPDILKHYNNLFLYLLIFSTQRYEDKEEKFSEILITCYLLLIFFTDMKTEFDVIFVNITSLLSSISKIAYPKQKGFLSKLKPREILSTKSPLSHFFLFFSTKMEDTYVFNDFQIETKSTFISKLHNKIFANESMLLSIHTNYIQNVFANDLISETEKIANEIYYYYKGLVNKRTPFYYKVRWLWNKRLVNNNIRERIEMVSQMEREVNKERIAEMNNIRNTYKKIKQNLFSWNCAWSDVEVFYDENMKYKLKYKVLGHYTCDFMRPLMKPIIDIDYYLPKFTNFNEKDLFAGKGRGKQQKQQEIYSVNLNIRNVFPNNNDTKLFSLMNYCERIPFDNEITITKLMQMYEKKSLLSFKKQQAPPKDKADPNTKNNDKDINKTTNNKNDTAVSTSNTPSSMLNTTPKVVSSSTPSSTQLASKAAENLVLKEEDFEDVDFMRVSQAMQRRKEIQTEVAYCCIVKHSYHISGKLTVNKTITFEPIFKHNASDNDEFNSYLKNPMNYDFDRKTCFGSIFTSSKKENDYISFSFPITDIKLIFKRNYFYQSNSIELFTYNNKNIFIKFHSISERNQIFSILNENFKFFATPDLSIHEIRILGRSKDANALDQNDIVGNYVDNNLYSHSTVFVSSGSDLHKKWSKYEMSTFAFIMWTNLLGNRSYLDINQYPVFPWIIQDYLSDKIVLNKEYLRNLKLPMGMVLPPNNVERAKQRKESFLEIYKIMLNELREEFEMELDEENENINNNNDNDNNNDNNNNKKEEKITTTNKTEEMKKIAKDEEVFAYIARKKIKLDFETMPYYYGSHYSNALYTNHYLMRLFPYASLLIEIQGNKFDDPQRLFHNLHLTFSSATSQKSDVRELCPEFFYFNQMFMNVNDFHFGKAIDITTSDHNAQYIIGNVQLPKWADDNAYVFVEKQRTILEEKSSETIHEWVDLMFGSKQTGHRARKYKNVFIPYSYEGVVKLDEYKDKKLQMHLRLAEMGLSPIKVYYNEVKERGKPLLKNHVFAESTKRRQYETALTFGNSSNSSSNKTASKHHKDKQKDKDNIDKPVPVYYMYDNDSNCIYVALSDLSRSKIEISSNKLNEYVVTTTMCYVSPFGKENNTEQQQQQLHMQHFLKKMASCHNNTRMYPYAYALYNKGEVLVVGGFWDGSLIMLTKENKIEYILNPSYNTSSTLPPHLKPTHSLQIPPSPITFILLNNNNTIAYCGDANGRILQFAIENKTKWTFTQAIHSHINAIKYISINTNLQMLASIGEDNYVFIYVLPSLKVASSMRFGYEQYIADYVFLASSPVPCCTLYSVVNNEFKVFDINGNYMISLRDDTDNIISPVVYTSAINFKDYLVYVNEKEQVIVRKFPFMVDVNVSAIKAKKLRKARFMCLKKDGKGLIVIGNDLNILLIESYEDI